MGNGTELAIALESVSLEGRLGRLGSEQHYHIPKIWASQITADYSLRLDNKVRGQLLDAYDAVVDQYLAGAELVEFRKRIVLGRNAIATNSDTEIKTDSVINETQGIALFENMKQITEKITGIPFYKWNKALGGSPAISALAEMKLNPALRGVSHAYYAGNYVASASEIVENEFPEFALRFGMNRQTEHMPATLSLENNHGKGKLMFSSNSGRTLAELYKEDFCKVISQVYMQESKAILAIGGLNKGTPEEYGELVRRIQVKNPNIRLFAGTNSFKSEADAKGHYREVLAHADIVSYNEKEIKAVFEALIGKSDNITLVDMAEALAGLNSGKRQIVVCHTEGGAIATYRGKNDALVNHALSMATDGASYRYFHGGFGSEEEISSFNGHVPYANAKFEVLFGIHPAADFPKGIYRAVARDFSGLRPVGSITGAGATFDGVALSYLAPLVYE